MNIGLYYDQSFKAKFGADSYNAMKRVLDQVYFLAFVGFVVIPLS